MKKNGKNYYVTDNGLKPGKEKKPRLLYFTDPFCIASYAGEKELEKFAAKYSSFIQVEIIMGGLMPLWEMYRNNGVSTFEDMARSWTNLGAIYKLPISGKVWLTDPPHSSFPPSIAFKAAQLQSEEKALYFLKIIRELLFGQNKNITNWEVLNEAALKAGLDVEQFKEDRQHSAFRSFERDLHLAENFSIHAFPTLVLEKSEDENLVLEGYQNFSEIENALQRIVTPETSQV